MKYQVIILGAGTAGLSAAQYCRYHGLSTLVVEQMAAGGQALNIPEITNLSGLPIGTSGIDFAGNLETEVQKLGAEFIFNRVDSISQVQEEASQHVLHAFQVRTSESLYHGSQVILATGSIPKKLSIPGAHELEGRGISYCAPCDGPLFRGKKVGVIGGGDAAFEEALYLASLASEVHLIIRNTPVAQPYLQDQVIQKKNIYCHLKIELVRINSKMSEYGFPVISTLETNQGTIEVEGLFVMIGSIPEYPQIHLMNGNTLNRTHKDPGYPMTDEWCETSVPGLFCIGAARKQPFAQIQVGLADGAIAARKAFLNTLTQE